MNTHCRDSGNQIYLWFSLLIKMGNFLCWNSLLDKIVQVAPLNTKKLTENYFGIHGPHLPWYIMICRHVFIFSMYVHCTYLTTLCRSCGGKLELYACQQKKTLPPTAHILHCYYYYYYCGGHGVYINKNGPLNLWDWFILFMNCLLRMT